MKWRANLKRIPILFEANARFRTVQTRMQYRSLMKDFPAMEGADENSAGRMVGERLRARNKIPAPKKKGALRIFYVGTDYSQDSSGILQGLARFGEVITFEARPGEYGALWPRDGLLSVREENSLRLVEEVGKAIEKGPVDIVLGQMWGCTMSVDALRDVGSRGPVVVNISMDDRHAYRWKKVRGEWTGTSGVIPALDLAATAAPECCSWYVAEGCPAIFFPEASDPDLFHPFPGLKQYDVCFVGANYGIRKGLIDALRRSGIRVAAYGKGWTEGPIPTVKMPELFGRSKIVLGVGTIGYSRDFFALKMRDFDAPMSGSLYLTHHNPDLESLYDIGREIVTYKTFDDCVAKVLHYLQHPELAAEIGMAGRTRALRDHTWEKRFEALFKAAGILEVPSVWN